MNKPKKTIKFWIYALILGVLLVGGGLFILSRTSLLPHSWKISSKCKFDPTISKKNKALIDETFSTVADDGLFSLMGKKSHLEDMGTILSNEVPDLSYWAYVLSDPKLTKDMKTIQDSSAKYNGFIEGTRDRIMKEYHENPCLLEQAEGFAEYVKLPKDKTVAILKECIDHNSEDKHGFKKFLDYLFGEEGKSPDTKAK
ncbi:MAG: hypothetical protein K2Y01_00795 [Rhabdochlamydiaceae bacterium]|nr:hypothetical protein [Rhabdochlamydiaceae bacterium]